MPVFRATPTYDLGAAIRRAVASSNMGPMAEVQADMAAAQSAKNLGLAEKARAEVEAMQRAEADRRNPQVATEYAGHVAGINMPEATRLSNHVQGVLEQPAPADVDDAMTIGREAQPYVTGKPNLEPGQERLFRSALASTIANRLATGHTNAEQLARAGGDINQEALISQAAGEPDASKANPIIAAVSKRMREPFKTNAEGTVLNTELGTLDESSKLAVASRAAKVAKAAKDNAAADGGGNGKGWTFYKDKDSNLLRFNANAGLVEKRMADGNWVQSDELPEGLTKIGNMLGGGALNARFSGRVLGAANEGYAAINTIAKLTDPNSGLFSAKASGGADGKGIVAGLLTPERVKRYNSTIAGLATEIAMAQNQGMAPHENQIAQVERAITIGPTDDDVTKRYKVALAARYLRKGLEVSMDLANPDQKKRATALLKDMEKIPDPDTIETENKGAGMFPKSPAVVPLKNVKGWVLQMDAKGNRAYVSPDGKEFEEVK